MLKVRSRKKMKLTVLQMTIPMQATITLVIKTMQSTVVTRLMTTIHILGRKQIKFKKCHPMIQAPVLMKVHFLKSLMECFDFSAYMPIVYCGMDGHNTSMQYSYLFSPHLYHMEYSYSVLLQCIYLGYSFRIFNIV